MLKLRWLAGVALLLALAGGARAQTLVTITGTIVDPSGVPYGPGNATINIEAIGGTPLIILATNQPVNSQPVVVPIQPNGFFTATLVSSNSIGGSPSYDFRFCLSNPIQPPIGTGTSCFTAFGLLVTSNGDQSNNFNNSSLPLVNPVNVSRVVASPFFASGSSQPPRTIVATVPAAPAGGTHYNLLYYLSQQGLTTGCTGNTTIVFNIIFQDPNAAAPQTVALATYTITLNGTSGVIPFTTGTPGQYTFLAAPNSVVQWSTTFTRGTGCTVGPTASIYPTIEVK